MSTVQEIQELLASWSGHISQASLIFLRCPKYTQHVFMGPDKKAPFAKDDARIRTIPFATRRPTLKEVKSVHCRLAAIYFDFEVTPGQTVQDRSLREQAEGSGGGIASERNSGTDSTAVTEKVEQWMTNAFSEEGNLRLQSPIVGCEEIETGEEKTDGRIAGEKEDEEEEEGEKRVEESQNGGDKGGNAVKKKRRRDKGKKSKGWCVDVVFLGI